MKDINFKSAIQKLQYKNVEEGLDIYSGAIQASLPGLRNIFKGTSKEISGMTNLMINTEEQHRLKEENALAHAPVYSYNKGTFTNTTNKFNSINGIILLRLVPDNENYVKKFINNFGYEVYEFVNTEIFNHMHINGYTTFIRRNIHYNVIKFDNSNVSGSFPKEIADTLNDILESGVKIWYDYQMTEDNYVI